MNANFVISIIGAGLLSLGFVHASEEPLRFDQLRTLQNDTFHQVEVIKVDATGAYLRHSKGMARVRFMDLPKEKRPTFEDRAMPFNSVKETVPSERTPKSQPVKKQNWIVVRTVKPAPAISSCGCPNLLSNTPGVLPYPQSLAIYPCRKLAELDFLYVTGILRRPPGVKIHRLSGTRFY